MYDILKRFIFYSAAINPTYSFEPVRELNFKREFSKFYLLKRARAIFESKEIKEESDL